MSTLVPGDALSDTVPSPLGKKGESIFIIRHEFDHYHNPGCKCRYSCDVKTGASTSSGTGLLIRAGLVTSMASSGWEMN